MEWILIILIPLIVSAVITFFVNNHIKLTISNFTNKLEEYQIPPPQVNVNLDPLQKDIRNLPNKLLQSIQGSINTKKGIFGELIGYTQLKAEYDRIIPLGSICDFMCISFPTKDSPGKVDFVDVKTGKFARLSADQKALQKLIKEKQINFLTISIDTVESSLN